MPAPVRVPPEAERRQLTVMFCDLVGSTDLSSKLDPEDLREVVRAYQEAAAEVIERYEGHIAQYLGDGLLIYFGFPVAHEDDAQRAVYTGLEIPDAIATLNTRLEGDYGVQLAVRIGIHTGPVVVGEMGSGGRHENLALGETPNIAARLESLAQPNSAILSPVTAQLVQRTFVLAELGAHELKGFAAPMRLYTVVAPRMSDPADDGGVTRRFDALVGRDEEIGLLLRRWEQSKAGLGQVVLLSGEAGIGKSSLVDGLRDHVREEGLTRIAFRCSPYHTNSALYPIIAQVQRALGWQPEDTADIRLAKLEQALAGTGLPPAEAVPLLAALLSLPLPEGRYAARSLRPQQQRQQTLDVLVAWLLEEAERQAVLAVWEDLHWADPSTLEALGLLVEQAPTAAMLHVLTFRPEFAPPWPTRSHLTPITLNRLERPQVEAMLTRLARGKALPQDVVDHIVLKTDGVPLYVEELTKMLLASDLLREEAHQYVLTGPLRTVAIPDTLQDSLMARLDQLNTAKEVAQLGSVLGREFAYDLLQAVASQADATLQAGLSQLVEAELLYQRGRPPRARYVFKHALIQDAAYASLLRSTRQRVHERIVQVLERRFPEVVETQPEWVAHHCTEAGRAERAVHYWQRAGDRAFHRGASAEVIEHLSTGLALLQGLPETAERAEQELTMQLDLALGFSVLKGYAAPETENAYRRARVLNDQVGDARLSARSLLGLGWYYFGRGDLRRARELAEQAFAEAQGVLPSLGLSPRLLFNRRQLGGIFFFLGEFVGAREHLEHGMALCASEPLDPQQVDLFVQSALCQGVYAGTLWYLGYPDQARQQSDAAVTRAREVKLPAGGAAFEVAGILQTSVDRVLMPRGDLEAASQLIEEVLTLSIEHDLAYHIQLGRWHQGMVRFRQGEVVENADFIDQFLAAWRSMGLGIAISQVLAYQGEVAGRLGETEAGLSALREGLRVVEQTDERYYEAELHRLQGELLRSRVPSDEAEAERSFQQALAVARAQHAKSWELRAATSLARLWQSQDKRQEAYDLLAPVYEWFTEGFDTTDLQAAKALLSELST